MPEPTLDPHTDQLLDERVRTARTELQRTIGDVPPPALRTGQTHNEQRRMLVAAVAIAAVLATGSLAFLAAGQESSVSTTDAPTPPPDEQPPTATDETTTSTTTAPTTTSTTPAPEPTTAVPPAEQPAPPPPAQQQQPEDPAVHLLGRTFAGTTVTEAGQPRPLVEDTEITVTFEHNQHTGEDGVRWNAGCNTAGAPVAISADRLDLGPDGGSTSAGCEQDRYDQDDWLWDFFHADPYWRLDGGTLTLTVDDTVITLVEQP